jgi:LuxR family maltose regulon positive regulatory protein
MTEEEPSSLRLVAPTPDHAAWGLFDAHLTPPPPREGLVTRHGLLRRLGSRRHVPLLLVEAPAGYGKTTLLSQWLQHDQRSAAWITVSPDCDDPLVFTRYLAVALARVIPLRPDLLSALSASRPKLRSVVLPGLADAIAEARRPFILVIDDAHLLSNPRCLEELEALVDHLPEGSQLALGTRPSLPIPIGRLHAADRVEEIGIDDLRFDAEEILAFLVVSGYERPDPSRLRELADRTEGWPAGLYLGLHGEPKDPDALRCPTGDQKLIRDFIRTEFLADLDVTTRRFLLSSSVLDELSGSLCDRVLGIQGSGALLERLAASNLLIVPLDDTSTWFRYQQLFRDALRAEFRARSPSRAAKILARAAGWCERDGRIDVAIRYAQASGDTGLVARLITTHVQARMIEGAMDQALAWLSWFDEHGDLASHPELAPLGGWVFAMAGQDLQAARWAAATGRSGSEPSSSAPARTLRAVMAQGGAKQMWEDADNAAEQSAPGGPWYPLSLLLRGVASLALGGYVAATADFTSSAEAASQLRLAHPAAAVAHAELAFLAIATGEIAEAERHVQDGRALIDVHGLEHYPSSRLLTIARARLALYLGDRRDAERLLEDADGARPFMTRALGIVSLQYRIESARAHMGLGELSLATEILDEADAMIEHEGTFGALEDEIRELRAELATLGGAARQLAALTPAEMRLLPLLRTHLSFREIGEELFVSPYTVKTQAISIYRKLGVSSRSEAVQAARATGILAPLPGTSSRGESPGQLTGETVRARQRP